MLNAITFPGLYDQEAIFKGYESLRGDVEEHEKIYPQLRNALFALDVEMSPSLSLYLAERLIRILESETF